MSERPLPDIDMVLRDASDFILGSALGRMQNVAPSGEIGSFS